MPKSESKKTVNTGNLWGVAQDHMTVVNAEIALRNKTANLSTGSAAERLARATGQGGRGATPQQSGSATPANPAAGQSKKK
jgi:hypothetical protein